MGHPKVRVTNYFKFTDRSFMGWVGYDGRPKVPYYVMQLFGRHFGTQLVQAGIGGPTYRSKAMGLAASESQVPELTVVASINDSGRLFVNIVSRSWQTVHPVRLQFTGFEPTGSEGKAWIITADSPRAHNGRDLPPGWPIRYSEPGAARPAADPVRIVEKSWNIKKPFAVPPHSIVTLEIAGRKVASN